MSAKHLSEVYIKGDKSGLHTTKSVHDEIFLQENEEYLIVLQNNHTHKMVADVYIGGNSVGSFVVPSNTSRNLDRPIDKKNKFKCVTLESLPQDKIDLLSNVELFDLVKVVVSYEKPKPRSAVRARALRVFTDSPTPPGSLCCETDSVDSGSVAGTVLSKNLSTTNFITASSFPVIGKTDTYIFKLRCKHGELSPKSKLLIEDDEDE